MGVHDHLREHRIVCEPDLHAAVEAGVDPHPSAAREAEVLDRADGRHEACGGVLRVDAHLDRVSAHLDGVLSKAQRLSCRDPELLTHEVDARHHLCHGVLDLQAGVHLKEEELSPRPEELDRPCALVIHGVACLEGDLAHLLPHRGVDDD